MSFLFLFAFMRLFVLFVLVKFYRKKKIKKSKITPDNLIHYTTKTIGKFKELWESLKSLGMLNMAVISIFNATGDNDI